MHGKHNFFGLRFSSNPSLLCRPRALAYRGSFSSTLLLLEDINLVPILHPAGLGDVLLAEAVTVEREADSLLAEAELLAVGVHQLSEGSGLFDPELHRGAATLVLMFSSSPVAPSTWGLVSTALGLLSSMMIVVLWIKCGTRKKQRNKTGKFVI